MQGRRCSFPGGGPDLRCPRGKPGQARAGQMGLRRTSSVGAVAGTCVLHTYGMERQELGEMRSEGLWFSGEGLIFRD